MKLKLFLSVAFVGVNWFCFSVPYQETIWSEFYSNRRIVSNSFMNRLYIYEYEIAAKYSMTGPQRITNIYWIDGSTPIPGYETWRNGTVHCAARIADFGFTNQTGITSVEIANWVSPEDIDRKDFYDALVGLRFYEYSYSTGEISEPITNLHAMTRIGNSAFRGCVGLTNLICSARVEAIGNDAFAECENLSDVVVGEDLVLIGSNAFAGAYITNLKVLCAPPSGLIESGLLNNYPSVSYPQSSAAQWQTLIADHSTNLL